MNGLLIAAALILIVSIAYPKLEAKSVPPIPPLATADQAASKKLPLRLMSKVAWSLAEPTPRDASGMIEAVRGYHQEIDYPFEVADLTTGTTFRKIDIVFTYGKNPWYGGEWWDVPVYVRVESNNQPLTGAEILFRLQTAAYPYLKRPEQDQHYFEGLHLCAEWREPDVPLYRMTAGS